MHLLNNRITVGKKKREKNLGMELRRKTTGIMDPEGALGAETKTGHRAVVRCETGKKED